MIRSPVRRLLRVLVRAWRHGVYINELLLTTPWERDGQLRWRREPDGWTLVGITLPAEEAGELQRGRRPGRRSRSARTSAPARTVDPSVNPRPGPSSC